MISHFSKCHPVNEARKTELVRMAKTTLDGAAIRKKKRVRANIIEEALPGECKILHAVIAGNQIGTTVKKRLRARL